MKYTVVLFALFAAATAELTKVQRPAGKIRRQAGANPQVQNAVMTGADGTVKTFDTAGVYKAATDAGL
ncbi:hypothetical protein F4779DRAFT_620907 [Xylariaceae sp. FL0662B]|nr:hypothetical protein F4779DRAFT_620907 [Xylariaceae sp. FL0662B]